MIASSSLADMLKEDSWGRVAAVLDQADSIAAWEGEAGSFTEWLRIKASESGTAESTLWRYLGAGRFYRELASTLKAKGLPAPSLKTVSRTVSPESLEILSKISRAAPESVFLDIAVKLLNGSVTRAALRRTWSAYRPVLEGRTARGGGAGHPRADHGTPETMESVLMATVLAALSGNIRLLADVREPVTSVFATEVAVELAEAREGSVIFDAVAACRSGSRSGLVLNGIEIVGGRETSLRRKLEILAPFCDRLWIAIHEDNFPPPSDTPSFAGILVADSTGSLSIQRHAKPSRTPGSRSGELARALLLKQLS